MREREIKLILLVLVTHLKHNNSTFGVFLTPHISESSYQRNSFATELTNGIHRSSFFQLLCKGTRRTEHICGVSSCCSQRFGTLLHRAGRPSLANEVRLFCGNFLMAELLASSLAGCLCHLRHLDELRSPSAISMLLPQKA